MVTYSNIYNWIDRLNAIKDEISREDSKTEECALAGAYLKIIDAVEELEEAKKFFDKQGI